MLFIDDFTETWTTDYCFAWAWYLSNDFHMFLTAPVIIYVLLLNKKIGAALVGALFVLFSGVEIFVWLSNGYNEGQMDNF